MPAELYRFHMHSLDEIDIACRLWGVTGVRAVLDAPASHTARTRTISAVKEPRSPRQRAVGVRTGFGWLRLRRAPHAGVR